MDANRASTIRRFRTHVWVPALTSIVLAGCSPTGPSPPPTIAGAWTGDVNGVRIRLDLTETRPVIASTVITSVLELNGSGTLTLLSGGDSAAVTVTGSNFTDTAHGGGQVVLFNLFPKYPLPDTYGQFNGAISGGTLVGRIVNDYGAASRGPFFGPESVAAVFHRP